VFVGCVGVLVDRVGVFVGCVGVLVDRVGVFVGCVGVFVNRVGVFVGCVGVFVDVTGRGVLMLDGVIVATRGAALAIPVGVRNPERYATTDTTENIC
jgi:hypothetical protein